MNERYAVVAKVRMQVGAFVSNPQSVSNAGIIVDLQNHPQKDEVQEDWFYDKETNTFSADGEVVYPEPVEPRPTEEEIIQAEILLNQIDIIAKQNEQDEVLATILLNQMGV